MSTGYPETALGSPPAARTSPEELVIIAYDALRGHAGVLGMLGGAPLHDWYQAGGDVRAAVRAVTDAVVEAMPQHGPQRAIIDALHDHCSETIGSLEDRLGVALADVERLGAIIAAADGPQVTPDDLAPVLWAAYVAAVRDGLPAAVTAVAPALADWDDLPAAGPTGWLARTVFTAVARMAIEQARPRYDQAAELVILRGELQEIHDLLADAYGRDDLSEETTAVVAGLIAERNNLRAAAAKENSE